MTFNNEELKAKVNTKAGLTREIERVMGGKQGGKAYGHNVCKNDGQHGGGYDGRR